MDTTPAVDPGGGGEDKLQVTVLQYRTWQRRMEGKGGGDDSQSASDKEREK
jgi:hypothetical protein